MIRRTLAAVTCTALLLGLFAAGASAATSVTQEIKAQDKVVNSDPEQKALAHLNFKTAAEAKAAIPKIDAFAKVIDNAATKVSQASATTSAQKTGQKDWVAGAQEQATGVRDLATELQDLINKDKSAAVSEAKKAIAIVKKGVAEQAKGDKLLGLPTKD